MENYGRIEKALMRNVWQHNGDGNEFKLAPLKISIYYKDSIMLNLNKSMFIDLYSFQVYS